MVRVTVPVPGRAYEVTIGPGILASAEGHLPALPGATTAFVISDRAVSDLYYESLANALGDRGLASVLLLVPVGEEAKSLRGYESLLRQLAGREAHRNDAILALGGGAVGDLAGFVASTYMRGVPFVQIPTTLTAQVDAAIGGKTAVNLPEGKNLVGTFAQPIAVLADVDVLATLDERDFRSGLAEVAKYALTLDDELLALLENDPSSVLARDVVVMEDVIARCVAAKARIVAEDERDASARQVLNYGHTLGHGSTSSRGGRTERRWPSAWYSLRCWPRGADSRPASRRAPNGSSGPSGWRLRVPCRPPRTCSAAYDSTRSTAVG